MLQGDTRCNSTCCRQCCTVCPHPNGSNDTGCHATFPRDNPKNGWAINAGEGVENQEIRDKLEANQIYELIENEIAPLYYTRDKNGIPMEWINRVKQSIYDVGKNFNIHRMLNDYCEKFYIPASKKINAIFSDNYKKLKEITEFDKTIYENWDKLKFLDVNLGLEENSLLNSGDTVNIKAKIDTGNIDPKFLRVEIMYRYNDNDYKIIPLEISEKQENIINYAGDLKVEASGKQYVNLRIRPIFENLKTIPKVKWYYQTEEK